MYRASFGRLPVDGIDVCSLEHAGPLPPPWLAPGFVVNLVLEGSADLVARGRTHAVIRGSVVLADAGEMRRVARRHSPRAVTRSLTFSEVVLQAALRDRGRTERGSLHFGENVTPRLRSELHALYDAVDELAPTLVVESAIERVLDGVSLELSSGLVRRWPRHPGVRRAHELLHSRFLDDVTLGELAAEASLSRAHLIREFRRELGLPPHAYLIQLRIAHARWLLARGVPSADVSRTCGFFDQSHLTRHFRRLVGTAPGRYARSLLASH